MSDQLPSIRSLLGSIVSWKTEETGFLSLSCTLLLTSHKLWINTVQIMGELCVWFLLVAWIQIHLNMPGGLLAWRSGPGFAACAVVDGSQEHGCCKWTGQHSYTGDPRSQLKHLRNFSWCMPDFAWQIQRQPVTAQILPSALSTVVWIEASVHWNTNRWEQTALLL